ncbi:MAG: YjjG family noncanonical pyrimidine nucleotidase [Flavobacteriales bacterium]|nr:YjjG family noncanonical pyrimidine nucleotidase [Flavobacteriales bacterium]
MRPYRHIFFDLDHTLWDLRTNSRDMLAELYADLDLAAAGVPDVTALIEVYEEINGALWKDYGLGRIPKEVLRVLRFRNTLGQFGVNDADLARRMAREYLERCPHRTALNPGARETLAALLGRVKLHIITNGFREVQAIKLRASGIEAYFDLVLTSEEARAHKPDPRIFSHALERVGAGAAESLMVGDDARNDVAGARGSGIDQVHYVPDGLHHGDTQATHRIDHLERLVSIVDAQG